MSKKIQIRSEKLDGAEVSWFAPICDGDDRYLGERNMKYKSNWENTLELFKSGSKKISRIGLSMLLSLIILHIIFH